MRVFQYTTSDEGITNPKRSAFGITLALRWGDVLHPLGQEGNWFKPPYFERVLRFSTPFAIPALCFALWFYLVLLAFGVSIANFGYWGLLSAPLLATFPIVPGAWMTWNLWGWRGYCGMKFFGVDAPEYKLWPAMKGMEHEVYPGSQAIQFSARLKISD